LRPCAVREAGEEDTGLGHSDGRVRRAGAARKPLAALDGALVGDLEGLVVSKTAGDPQSGRRAAIGR
jgi:hypothetical protein